MQQVEAEPICCQHSESDRWFLAPLSKPALPLLSPHSPTSPHQKLEMGPPGKFPSPWSLIESVPIPPRQPAGSFLKMFCDKPLSGLPPLG